MTSVATLMHPREQLPLVLSSCPMSEVILTMTARSFGIAGVLDGTGRLVGVVTDGDLRRNVDRLFHHSAGEVMTRNPVTISATEMALQAMELLQAHKITSLFVTSDEQPGHPVGLVHVHDFLRLGMMSP
jgi:arabinose-5-phosphate isomerase